MQTGFYRTCAHLTARHFVALEIMRLASEIRLPRVVTDGFSVAKPPLFFVRDAAASLT